MRFSNVVRQDESQSRNWGLLITALDATNYNDIAKFTRVLLSNDVVNDIGLLIPVAVQNGDVNVLDALLNQDAMKSDQRKRVLEVAQSTGLFDNLQNCSDEIFASVRRAYGRIGQKNALDGVNRLPAVSSSSSNSRAAAPQQTVNPRLDAINNTLNNLSLAASSSSSSSSRAAPMPNTPEAFYAAAQKNDQVAMALMLSQRNWKEMPELLKGNKEALDQGKYAAHLPLVHALKTGNNGLVEFLMPYYETAKLEITQDLMNLAQNETVQFLLVATGSKNMEWHDCRKAIASNDPSKLINIEGFFNLRQDKSELKQKLEGRGHELLKEAYTKKNITAVDVIEGVYTHCDIAIPKELKGAQSAFQEYRQQQQPQQGNHLAPALTGQPGQAYVYNA